MQPFCLISVADIVCIHSYLESESCRAPLLDFYCWYCLYEILPRLWVVCSFFSLFLLLIFPASNTIQRVSYVQLLCLISIVDILCLKLYPESQLCIALLLDFYYWHCLLEIHAESGLCLASHLYFHYWHCLHEMPSREWVISSSAWFPWLTFHQTSIKPHTDSALCAATLLDFHFWNCLYKIPFRLWVLCSSAWFLLLTLLVWPSIQVVSHMQLISSISISDIICLNFYPEGGLCVAPLLDFYCWHCLDEIPSREWVICSSFSWFPLLTLHKTSSREYVVWSSFAWFSLLIFPGWHFIQGVSHMQLLC